MTEGVLDRVVDVILDLRSGPMAGKRQSHRLSATAGSGLGERLTLGRDPGPGGFLLDGDVSVSRKHGALFLDGAFVVFENLSSNGSVVGGRVVMGQERLMPGSVLRLGRHEIGVSYTLPSELTADLETGGRASFWRQGPLRRPLVRFAIGAYLLALAGLTLLLIGSDDDGRSFGTARAAYEMEYLPYLDHLDDLRRVRRLEDADRLRFELDAQTRSEQWQAARETCRRLMAIDRDPESPMYRFAALRLADLAGKN